MVEQSVILNKVPVMSLEGKNLHLGGDRIMFYVVILNILGPWRSFLLMVYGVRNPMGLH